MKAILAPEQSRMARRALGMTQNQVIEKGHLSGYKLKQFESGFADPEGVAPFLRKLRDFYETQGHEFTDLPYASNDPIAGEAVRVVRDALIVCDRLTHSQRGEIQDRLRNLLVELQSDIRQKAGSGVFDMYDDATDLARDKAITVLAEVGVLYAALFGNCLFKTPSKALLNAPREAKTISDVLSIRFAEAHKFISGDADIASDSSDVTTTQAQLQR